MIATDERKAIAQRFNEVAIYKARTHKVYIEAGQAFEEARVKLYELRQVRGTDQKELDAAELAFFAAGSERFKAMCLYSDALDMLISLQRTYPQYQVASFEVKREE